MTTLGIWHHNICNSELQTLQSHIPGVAILQTPTVQPRFWKALGASLAPWAIATTSTWSPISAAAAIYLGRFLEPRQNSRRQSETMMLVDLLYANVQGMHATKVAVTSTRPGYPRAQHVQSSPKPQSNQIPASLIDQSCDPACSERALLGCGREAAIDR